MQLKKRFEKEFMQMMQSSSGEASVISSANVYQECEQTNREAFYPIVLSLLSEGSSISGRENLVELARLAAAGHSCLIMPAHLSNFDVPVFWALMKSAGPEYEAIFEKIVFVAGRKLNEESSLVKMLTEMFTRVVISPKSYYAGIPEGPEQQRVIEESRAINFAAHRMIKQLKHQDRMFVIFPTGTRYRPWDERTGRGLREAETYLRSFDYFIVGATAGNIMPPTDGEMSSEETVEDRIRMHFGPVHDTAEFRHRCFEQFKQLPPEEQIDNKQFIIDKVMEEMRLLEKQIEPV